MEKTHRFRQNDASVQKLLVFPVTYEIRLISEYSEYFLFIRFIHFRRDEHYDSGYKVTTSAYQVLHFAWVILVGRLIYPFIALPWMSFLRIGKNQSVSFIAKSLTLINLPNSSSVFTTHVTRGSQVKSSIPSAVWASSFFFQNTSLG